MLTAAGYAVLLSTRSPAIVPSLNQPVRAYPLRTPNEPAVYVLGERQGQKVYPNGPPQGGMGGPDRGPQMPPGPMGMGFNSPQAMLAQQTSAMDALERRSRVERERSSGMSGVSIAMSSSDNQD